MTWELIIAENAGELKGSVSAEEVIVPTKTLITLPGKHVFYT